MATLLTDAGRDILTNRLRGSGTEPIYGAWGTGAGTSGATDTTLFTEDSGGSPAYARTAGTPSRVTVSVANDTWQLIYTLVANAAKTITNAGIFDALTSGNLFVKTDFTGYALDTGESIQFTWQVQFA